uniref:Tyrosine-protein kinase ephrin type A/B receptor-like domain-containing protein n=1 Tax=Ciona intestinalis TaxID=7719 RepID=H2XV88_CIOIN
YTIRIFGYYVLNVSHLPPQYYISIPQTNYYNIIKLLNAIGHRKLHFIYYNFDIYTGTGNYQENPCPVGHYCPEGGVTSVGGVTGQAIPCPAGTYADAPGSVAEACISCLAGMYNNLEGQPACFPCGSSAVSGVGATECTCLGQFCEFVF